MSDENQSEESSLVLTPTEDDDVFMEPVAGPSDASSLSTTMNVFYEKIKNEVKQWIEEHSIDEERQQALRARFSQTQEIARSVKTTVLDAVGNVVKHVEEVVGSSDDEQHSRKLQKLLEPLRECEEERNKSAKARKLNEIWAEYINILTEHDNELFKRTKNFRNQLYKVETSM